MQSAKLAGAEVGAEAREHRRGNQVAGEAERRARGTDQRTLGQQQPHHAAARDPSTRNSASCARRRTTDSACAENTRNPR